MTIHRLPLLLLTRGIPGSGKSTWARDAADAAPHGQVKTVSLDDLRQVIDRNDGSKPFDRALEDLIQRMQADIVVSSIEAGHDVIVHNTHVFAKIPNLLRRLTAGVCDPVIVDFTDTPYDVSYERNLQRADAVPPQVVEKMHADLGKGKGGFKGWEVLSRGEAVERLLWSAPVLPVLDPYVGDPTLPSACVVDLDGTLAKHQGRSPYDESRVEEDRFDELVWQAASGFDHIVLLSGRTDSCYDATMRWLNAHGVYLAQEGTSDLACHGVVRSLHMRATGDRRPDSIVKREILLEQVAPHFNVQVAIDDRDSVVNMWRRIGLPCFQVAPGRF